MSPALRCTSMVECIWVSRISKIITAVNCRIDSDKMSKFFSKLGKVKQMENIEQRVKKIVAEQLGVNESEIKIESSFVNDLGADSLDTVELVMALEEEFETEIPDEEAEKITTVQQAINYVQSHVKA